MCKLLMGAQQGKHWPPPMEMEKDSPDGVIFLSLKERTSFCQAKEGKRGCQAVNSYVNEGMQGHGQSGELKSRLPWFDQSLNIGHYSEKLEPCAGLNCHVGHLSWGSVILKTGKGQVSESDNRGQTESDNSFCD